MIKEIGEYKTELFRNCIAYSNSFKIPCVVKLSTNDEFRENEVKILIQNSEDEKNLELLIQVSPHAAAMGILDIDSLEMLLELELLDILTNKRVCEISMQRQFDVLDEIDKKLQKEHPDIVDENNNMVLNAINYIIENL